MPQPPSPEDRAAQIALLQSTLKADRMTTEELEAKLAELQAEVDSGAPGASPELLEALREWLKSRR